ncbi:RNA-binding domain-containing protein [Tricholoma matsutake]|nr:RNA-binding domain-containing protein [Tricholoma matsutake 945]
MAKTEKKVDKKSKVTEPKVHKKKSSASKTKDIVTTAVKKTKSKPPAKVVAKDDTESDSSDSEPEKAAHPITNGKSADLTSEESSEDSSSEDEKPKAAQVKASQAKSSFSHSPDSDEPPPTKVTSKAARRTADTNKKVDPKKTAHSSSSSDDSVESTPKKVSKGVTPITPKTKSTSRKKDTAPKQYDSFLLPIAMSSDSDSSDDSDDDVPGHQKDSKAIPSAAKVVSSTSSDDSDSSAQVSRPNQAAASGGASDDSSSESSDEDSDVEMASAPVINAGKRKAIDTDPNPPKKVKLSDGDAVPADTESKSVFVGRLSWSVDNDRLAQEFSSCGEVVSATVQMDRNTGKSRGFGYVHFATAEAVEKALQMNGQEIDGRAVNIDRSQAQDRTQAREKRAQAFNDETSPPSTTLFVGNLSFGVTEDTVWSFFNEWGVKSVRLPTDRETGRPKGFGYVEFEDIEGAKKAFEGAAGAEIEGRSIRLDFSQPRDSSGGGFGGSRGGFGGGRGGRGGFGDRGGRGGRGGRGSERGGRGRGGRGTSRGGPRTGGIASFEGRKTTF